MVEFRPAHPLERDAERAFFCRTFRRTAYKLKNITRRTQEPRYTSILSQLPKRRLTLRHAVRRQPLFRRQRDRSERSSVTSELEPQTYQLTRLTASRICQRRNILFDDDATFPSNSKFISECKKRLYRTYGVTAWVNQNEARYVVLRCSLQTQGCGFRVRAERRRDEKEWSLAPGRCVWVHNHDMEGDEEERASWGSSEDEADEGGSEKRQEPKGADEPVLAAGALGLCLSCG